MSVALYLDFLNSTTLDARVTAAGAGNGTIVDSLGLINFAPNNRALYSQDFAGASWNTSNFTRTTGQSDPLGGTNATLGTYTSNGGNGTYQSSLGTAVSKWATNIISIYAKYGTQRWFEFTTVASGVATRSWVDMLNGVAGTANHGNFTVASVGGGWYRISAKVTVFLTEFYWTPRDANNNAGLATTNNGATFYVFGFQVEAVTYQTTPGTYNATTTTAYYGARYDFYPVTKAPRGLLIEELRINLIAQSGNFTNAAWSKQNANVAAGAITGPDGTLSATSFTPTTTPDPSLISTSITVANATVHTATIIMKIGAPWSWIEIDTNDGSTKRTWFNFATGTVGTVGHTSATISALANGFYAATITWTTAATTTRIFVEPRTANGDASAVTGDGSTVAFYPWGYQLEAGTFATSYIPTDSGAVTRSADGLSMTGTNFSNWFNQSEGTFLFEGDWEGSATATAYFLNVRLDGNNEYQIRANNSAGATQFAVFNGGVAQANINVATHSAGQIFKTASAYKVNDFSTASDATLGTPDLSGSLPSPTFCFFGSSNGASSFLNGHIRWFIYDNTRLVDATLIADTGINIGSITGAATVAGGGAAVFPSVGSITGAATVSSTGRTLFPSIGSSTGVGVATGIGLFPQTSIGTSAGAATVSGVSLWAQRGVGLSIGIGVASGVGQNIFPSPGTIVGAATVTGIGAFGVPSVGTIIGAATVLGAGTELFPSVGFSEGASIVFANGQWGVARAAHIDGAALVFGVGADGHTVPSDRSFRIPVQRRSIAVSD